MDRQRQMKLRRWIARNRTRPLAASLATAARIYLLGYENVDWDMESNGELRVISSVLGTPAQPSVVDVGANRGDWSAAVRSVSASAVIHAIEVVPDLAQELTRRFSEDAAIHVHGVGLLDRRDSVSVSYRPDRSELSHLVLNQTTGDGRNLVESYTTTGDEWIAEAKLGVIDLLKIDVEGFDLEVLFGFRNALAAGAIPVVQFEYNRAASQRGITLGNFYEFLQPMGYKIGKVYPQGVDFSTYDPARHEEYPGFNYVAAHRDHLPRIGCLEGLYRPDHIS